LCQSACSPDSVRKGLQLHSTGVEVYWRKVAFNLVS
jgi:hypothetical protein